MTRTGEPEDPRATSAGCGLGLARTERSSHKCRGRDWGPGRRRRLCSRRLGRSRGERAFGARSRSAAIRRSRLAGRSARPRIPRPPRRSGARPVLTLFERARRRTRSRRRRQRRKTTCVAMRCAPPVFRRITSSNARSSAGDSVGCSMTPPVVVPSPRAARRARIVRSSRCRAQCGHAAIFSRASAASALERRPSESAAITAGSTCSFTASRLPVSRGSRGRPSSASRAGTGSG